MLGPADREWRAVLTPEQQEMFMRYAHKNMNKDCERNKKHGCAKNFRCNCQEEEGYAGKVGAFDFADAEGLIEHIATHLGVPTHTGTLAARIEPSWRHQHPDGSLHYHCRLCDERPDLVDPDFLQVDWGEVVATDLHHAERNAFIRHLHRHMVVGEHSRRQIFQVVLDAMLAIWRARNN